MQGISRPSVDLRGIRRAIDITKKGFSYLREILHPGITEKEMAKSLREFILDQGADGFAFRPIIAAGRHSCVPHHRLTSLPIQDDQVVLVDIGVRIEESNSDLTRVYFLGKINTQIKKVYKIVKNACFYTISRLRSGMQAKEVDYICRSYIDKEGYSKYFIHSSGHGIGRYVHQGPRLSCKNPHYLKTGTVITIEPGIYLPGICGIRREEMVLIKDRGYELLS